MSWLTIRNFGRVKYFNLSYVVLIGVPLLTEAYRAVYSAATNLELQLSFPGTFKILYGASLCYAIAIAIYQYFCPNIVKHHESEYEYVAASQEIYERAHPDRKLEIVLAQLVETQDELRDEIANLTDELQKAGPKDRIQKLERLNQMVNPLYPSSVQRFLINEFRAAEKKNPIAIYISGVLYVVGTFLLIYLLVLRTYKVFSA